MPPAATGIHHSPFSRIAAGSVGKGEDPCSRIRATLVRVKLGRAFASAGLLLGMGAALFAAWSSIERHETRGAAVASACTCALERQRSGWCAACGVGYVAAREIRSKALYDALDAHGHDVDVPGLACSSCREAARTDGYCATHGRGFVGGRAYLSRLAYHVARGEPEKIERELVLLEKALETLERCELCAAAMVLDGTCPKCRLSYSNGSASAAR